MIHIPALGREAAVKVARNIELALRREFRLCDLPLLDTKVIETVSGHSPRLMRLRLKEMLGRMLVSGRTSPSDDDLKLLAPQSRNRSDAKSTDPLVELLSLTTMAALRTLSLQAAFDQAWISTRQSSDRLH